MNKRILAGILCSVLILGTTINVSAEEADAAIDGGEVYEEVCEEACEDSYGEVREEISEDTFEALYDEVADYSQEEGEGYFDISENLFFNGAISPQYEYITIDDEYNEYDVVGASPSRAYELGVYLYEKLKNGADSVDVTGFSDYLKAPTYQESSKKLMDSLTATCNEHPELFRLTGGYSYSYTTVSGGYSVTTMRPKYRTRNYDMDLLQARIDEALSVVKPGMTDEQKAIALHEYIVTVCEYDYQLYLEGKLDSHPDTYNMYGVLVDNMAVCQGYAETYKYLLNQVGITAYIVSSKNINHAWNMVKIGGELYQVDTTWDDPVWDTFGQVYHTYMLCSEYQTTFYNKHMKSNASKDWLVYADYEITNTIANGKKYDEAYWKNISSPFVYHDGYFYYTGYAYNKSVSVYRFNDTYSKENTASLFATVADTAVYRTSAFEMNNMLYFNSGKNIYAMNYATKVAEPVFHLSEGTMYRAMAKHGEVYYTISEGSGSQVKYKANLGAVTLTTYTVVFDSNGGTGSSVVKEYESGKTYNFISNTFTRSGYKFAGWNTKADGTGTTFAVGAAFRDLTEAGKTVTLYAKWEREAMTRTVQYMGMSLSFNGSITINQQFILSDDVFADKNAYVKYGDGTKVSLSQYIAEGDESTGTITFRINFAVKEIRDSKELKIYTSDGTVCKMLDDIGGAVSYNTLRVSVYRYLDIIAENARGQYEAINVAYAKGLIVYGDCATAYFGGGETGALTELSGITANTFADYSNTAAGSADGLEYLGTSLLLENNTTIRHYFKLESGYNISGYRFEYTKNNSYWYSAVLMPSDIKDIYYIDISGFSCVNFGTTYKLRMSYGGTFELKYGVYAYAYDALTNTDNEKLHNLVKAMYLFAGGA